MKLLLISLITLLSSVSVFSAPIELLEEQGCVSVFEEKTLNYLQDDDLLMQYAALKSIVIDRKSLDSLKLVSADDLQPGSFNLIRKVVLESDGLRVTVLTHGNLYCEDEKIVSIVDVETL